MQHLVNTNLIALAKQASSKQAFVPGDAAAGGAMPPGGDPAAAGGAPPMDPMAGGAPPMDPMAAGGGDPMAALQPMIDQAVQAAVASQGGGAGGGAAAGGGIKPKIDVNVEIMQMKKILAKISDALGIQIPAAEMVATPDDLNQMAAQEQGGAPAPGGAPGGGSAIAPIDPIQAAAPAEKAGEAPTFNNGTGYSPTEADKLEGIGTQAQYVLGLLNQ